MTDYSPNIGNFLFLFFRRIFDDQSYSLDQQQFEQRLELRSMFCCRKLEEIKRNILTLSKRVQIYDYALQYWLGCVGDICLIKSFSLEIEKLRFAYNFDKNSMNRYYVEPLAGEKKFWQLDFSALALLKNIKTRLPRLLGNTLGSK